VAALSTWCPTDRLLSSIAPLGLAASAGTALVIDLEPSGPEYGEGATLADLVRRHPRRSELSPSRSGVAVLRNGGVTVDEAAEILDALIAGWPAVVLRATPDQPPPADVPVVPVVPLLPGALQPTAQCLSVWQRTGFRTPVPGPGPVLPTPAPSVVGSLLRGVVDRRWRWVRAWEPAWRAPWI
jgi:hypothetical protein